MTVTPPTVPVWRGTSRPIAWRFKYADDSLFDLTGSTFQLSISHVNEVIVLKNTEAVDGLAIDIVQATVTWTPTLAESRLIPVGALSMYELERRFEGKEEILAHGKVEGIGGINADL